MYVGDNTVLYRGGDGIRGPRGTEGTGALITKQKLVHEKNINSTYFGVTRYRLRGGRGWMRVLQDSMVMIYPVTYSIYFKHTSIGVFFIFCSPFLSHLRHERQVSHARFETGGHLRGVENAHQSVLAGVDLDPVILVFQFNLLFQTTYCSVTVRKRVLKCKR